MTGRARESVTVAAIQCPLAGRAARTSRASRSTCARRRRAGAKVILPPELFEGPYFCREEKAEWFAEARSRRRRRGGDAHARRSRASSAVVVPVSFFERAGQAYYNSVAVIDADGALLGVYRKSHIPDGPGYEEKFYFRPGDTGFRVWPTRFGTLGVGICWDQWFPESARAMMLLGAEVLFYPTAIGSEPHDPDLDTRDPWQRAMVGHAVSNVVPVVAANRIGRRGRAGLLRLVLHRRRAGRQARGAGPDRRGRHRRPPSTSAPSSARALPGASSATAGPSSTTSWPRPTAGAAHLVPAAEV